MIEFKVPVTSTSSFWWSDLRGWVATTPPPPPGQDTVHYDKEDGNYKVEDLQRDRRLETSQAKLIDFKRINAQRSRPPPLQQRTSNPGGTERSLADWFSVGRDFIVSPTHNSFYTTLVRGNS